jgi:multicomponent Na+:H+ antiporter subunit B
MTEIRAEEPQHRPWLGGMLALATTAVLAVAVAKLPRPERLPPIAQYAIDTALPRWHSTEPVSEVVYGSRGFDTLGETFLLLAAVLGIGLITRSREARRGFIGEALAGRVEQKESDPQETPSATEEGARDAEEREGRDREKAVPDDERLGTTDPERAQGMTVVVRAATRFAAPVLIVAGLYLVAWGYTPGGGFPAGAVMLGVVLLVYAAFGYARVEAVLRPDVLEPVELGGALAIVLLGTLGLLLAGSFSANFLPLGTPETILAGGVMQAFSVTEFIEVGTGLTLAVFGLLGMERDWAPDDDPR